MFKTPETIYVEVADNVAVKSVIFDDKSAFISAPIYNVDGANPDSEPLAQIRRNLSDLSEIYNVSVFYVNHDLADEAIRQKRELGLLPKEN